MNNLQKKPLFPILKQIFFFLFSKEKKKIIALIFLISIAGLIPSVDSIFLQKITDLIESYTDENILSMPANLFKWAIIYALWWESLNILWRSYDYIYIKAIPNIKAQVIGRLYNYVQFHDQQFFQENLTGDITNRVTEASRSIEMIFAYFNEKILRKVAVLIFALITMYNVHYTVANIFLIWMTIFVGISLYFARTINAYSTEYGRNKAFVAGKIVDSFSNISAIRMFTSHRFERRYLKNYLHRLVKSHQDLEWFMFKLRYVLGISCSFMIFAIIYYILILRSNLLISIGDCVLVITLCLAVVDDVWDLTEEFGDLFEELGAFSQATTLLEKYKIIDKPDAKILEVSSPTIEFKNVTFFYKHNDNIFNDKSVFIPAKQKVGLVGFSGSGKTTFTNLVTRLFDIEKGEILIDGQNIKAVTQDSLRSNISIIPQEPILFHRTIMENIRYGNNDATDEEVIEAAKSAYIHEFIASLPDQYNTLCGERGNQLSGGQKQRIIIARAILKNAPILILDEATSSLDSHTEKLIQKSLHNLMKDKTVLVIAHRLSTLLDMDRILVFDRGHIVEEGTHKALKNNGKLYQKLWESQISGVISDAP